MPDFIYINSEEVARVCADIVISDCSKRTGTTVGDSEAETIRKIVGGEALDITLSDFETGPRGGAGTWDHVLGRKCQ